MLTRILRNRALPTLLPVAVVTVVLAGAFLVPSRIPFGGSLVACVGYGYCSGIGYNGTAAPTVTGLDPTDGSTAGGTIVDITGSGFCSSVTSVQFGATAATSFTVRGDTLLEATSPAHTAGTVDVTVTNPGGTSATSTADEFTFETSVPTVYTSQAPVRVLDTRSNGGKLGAGGTYVLKLGG